MSSSSYSVIAERWNVSQLSERLGLRYPIIQAPMASATTPALAGAVSNAGALGSLGLAFHSANAVRADCRSVREATNGSFNINFFVHQEPVPDAARDQHARAVLAPYFREFDLAEVPAAVASAPPFNAAVLEAVLEAKPPVVSFHFGLPADDLFIPLRDAGIFTMSSATNVTEARVLESRGVDAVIAQGFEAGGHRGTFEEPYTAGEIGTLSLVPQVVDAVTIPVIAAGGIADGRGIAAAFALGADGVQMGTAFLSCPESAADERYKAVLNQASADQVRLTRAFSGRPARGIENRYMREMRVFEESAPDFPILNTLTGPLRKASAKVGSTEFMSLWAGQSVSLSRSLPAADLIEQLVKETEETLRRLGGKSANA